jgi:hypothetical protein
MTEQPAGSVPLKPLILVPVLITLAVTLLRLTGELLELSPALFNRQAGGFLSIVGIVWLVPVFAIYFAAKLVQMGHPPDSAGRAVGVAFLSLLILVVAGFFNSAMHWGPGGRRFLTVFAVASIAAVYVALRGWPTLGRVLFAYGLGARIPVAVVMLVAILANWGTHYEKGAPGVPQMGRVATWFWIGLIPQMTIWMAFTVGVGTLVGGFAAMATARRLKPATA